MSYGMGYYGGGGAYGGFDPDEYEEQQIEEQPQQRQRGGQGLRAYAQRVQAENAELKARLQEAEEANRDLLGQGPQGTGYAPQNILTQQNGNPRSPILTQEEMMQMQRLQEMGVQAAPPLGSDREMANRIQNAASPEELMDILRSQGNTNGTQSYNGQGWQ
ncbi:hypothetical protein ADL25_22280 [Streptomyces sp. NRRL F-5122]|uniref:hypothetical protein n=1 Tax=Streptomyces sp. NRRL F-5122 TaxID=1609098 RepID=UPI00074111CD|nr:hypothetical protein [Streptomyces sp. NRRL F-5122]KUJ38964.1 hypothetical protein ADL25_22280 [Streptomyces sp. NRRL F-5122]